jgi:nucleoside-triphosphatase
MCKVFLTGEVGVGKTTVVIKVLDLLGGSQGGFRTERCPEGYKIVDIQTGSERLIATLDERGALKPHPQAFEQIGVAAIERASASEGLVVMDELGFLELEAPRFQQAVFAALRGPHPVLGVLRSAHNDFLDAIRALDNVEVIEVRQDNREGLPEEIAELLKP